MKRAILILSFFLLAASLVCQAREESPSADESKDKKDKISYSIGYDMGVRYKRILLNTNIESLLKGIRDAVNGIEPDMGQEELQKIMQNFFQDLRNKEEEKRKKLGEKNKKEGEIFLKENAQKEGVNVTKSGLQYKILREGTGPKPDPHDTVTIHYRGTLIDGTEFHDSYKSGEPVSFQLLKTFPGWAEALRMMKVGAKWKIFLPPDLAWGEDGLGDKVGPHAVIIFEIELLKTGPTDKEKEKKKSFRPGEKAEIDNS